MVQTTELVMETLWCCRSPRHHPAAALLGWRDMAEQKSSLKTLPWQKSCRGLPLQQHRLVPSLKTIIKIVLGGLLCGKRREMLCPAPRCRSPASPETPLLPLLQLTYLPPPWGECRSSEMGLDFFPVYSITACRIDCETRYIVENCNCKMVHMPGRCAPGGEAGTPPSLHPTHIKLEGDQGLKELGIPFPKERRMLIAVAKGPEIGSR